LAGVLLGRSERYFQENRGQKNLSEETGEKQILFGK
jgi:hypothetical protein